jgi:hypothetical protein
LAITFLISLIMGYFLCRSPISVDLSMRPPPVVASGETETSTPNLSCSKRVRREGTGDDLGCAGEDRQSSRLEVIEGEGRMEELGRPEVSTGIVSSSSAVAEAGLTRAEEAILTEVVASPPAIGEAVAGEVATADASSDPPGQEDTHAVAVKTMGETSARVEASEPPEPAAPSVQTVMSTFGMGIGAAAGPLLFGAASDSNKAPQGPLTARAAGSERGKAPPAPDAATKGASGEKIRVAAAGSGPGSLSSASQLQQDWVDTASRVKTSRKLKAQGNNLTLAELSRQLSVVKESLRNVNLQFLEASQTTVVSIMLSTFDFFYRLGGEDCNSVTNFSLHPSPRVSR